MIKRTYEIDLTGTELYAVQEIQMDLTGYIYACSVVAESSCTDANFYIEHQIKKLKEVFGKDNVIVELDKSKDRYTVKVSYDNEVTKGSFTIIYAITKLYL